MEAKKVLFNTHYILIGMFLWLSILYGVIVTPFKFIPHDYLFYMPPQVGVVWLIVVVLTTIKKLHDDTIYLN